MSKKRKKTEPEAKESKKRKRKRLPKAMPLDEFEKLLASPSQASNLGTRNRAAMALMGLCGLRVSEVCTLNTKHIYFDANPKYICVIGKGDKERRVWPTDAIIHLLGEWFDRLPSGSKWAFPIIARKTAGHINRYGVYDMIQHFSQKAKLVRHISPHTLRHTFAVMMLQSGKLNIKELQQELGHEKLETTAVYLELFRGGRPEAEKESVRKHPLFLRFFGEEE